MDAIEIGRQKASALHAQLVLLGHDPWSPLTFALAAVGQVGLSAESCKVGASLLHGARATFDPIGKLILYENAVDAFDRAFLIAHEIGHSQLGDDDVQQPSPPQIDPARSAEPPRTGADRVVDYGRRQRREIQMDLFARELLLPRVWLRQLHIDQGLTVEAIARRTGVPYEVVAQQMLDALLLPEQVAEKSENKAEDDLNAHQWEAVRHRGAPFVLEAGPGTGKTATLIGRIQHLLEVDKVDPRRILVLTFSNKAAGEVVDRVAKANPAAAASMWIGTFHAFGLDLIRRFADAFGLSQDPKILDRIEAIELLEHEFPRLKLTHYRDLYDPGSKIVDLLAGISRAKDEVVGPDDYRTLAETMAGRAGTDEQRLAAEKALEVAQVYAFYEALKQKKGAVDFGDLVMRPVQVLESTTEVRERLRDTYDHVLVDEYQDVNRSSVRLLQALTRDGTNLWVVGDARQSIYRFRGASSVNMRRFGKEDFPTGVRGRLKINYRSYQEVLDVAAAFSSAMKVGGSAEALKAHRGASKQRPELRKVGLAEEQAVAIADEAKALAKNDVRFRDQAVLCTGNEKLAEFAAMFEQLGIPVLFLGNLFERNEVRDALALASLLIDGRAMGLLRTARMPEFAMTLEDVLAVMSASRAHEQERGWWRANIAAIPDLSAAGRVALEALARALDGFDMSSTAWDVLTCVLLDRTRIAATLAQSTQVADRARGIALWQLLNFLRTATLGAGVPIQRTLDRIRRLIRFGDDRELRQLPAAAQSIDAMQLMTVHAAKGLEFQAVHFPGINAGAIPHVKGAPACLPPEGMIEGDSGDSKASNRAEQDAEQECLFYVALTRAKDRLNLYAATRMRDGKNRSVSSFVDRIGGTIQITTPKLSGPVPQGAADAPVELEIDGPIRLNDPTLGQLERCPRRVLYSLLIGIGGKRTPTPFLDMHGAVRVVLDAVIADDVRDEATHVRMLDEALATCGLDQHGYAEEYRAIAHGMVRNLHASRDGRVAQKPAAFRASFGPGEVHAKPTDVLLDSNGQTTYRRIATGHAREPDLGAIAFTAAIQAASPNAVVEFLSLADGATTPASFGAKKMSNSQEKIRDNFERFSRGEFPAEPSERTCPNCPALFVCGALPSGKLKKAFDPLPN